MHLNSAQFNLKMRPFEFIKVYTSSLEAQTLLENKSYWLLSLLLFIPIQLSKSSLLSLFEHPTGPFTILELHHPQYDVSKLDIVRQSPDLKL